MPRSGVSYSPEFHWIEAAAWANYQPDDFFELDGEKQSLIVAAYETHNQIEAVIGQDAQRKAQMKARAKR